MKTTRLKIIERLPELRSQIVDRLAVDWDFRSLCQDYEECTQTLASLSQSDLHRRVDEYQDLLAQLEEDIRQVLTTANDSLPLRKKDRRP